MDFDPALSTRITRSDGLDSLSGVELSIGIAAASFAAAGMDATQAIRRAIEVLQAVPATRALVAQEAEDSLPTITLDELRIEFQHSDHRQLREYVREIWGAAAAELWLRALDGEACFSKRQADIIRAHRIERRRRKPPITKADAAIFDAGGAGEAASESPNGALSSVGGTGTETNDNRHK